MLVHAEQIVQRVPRSGRCATTARRTGTFDLFAVEGGTAAMCYIFKSPDARTAPATRRHHRARRRRSSRPTSRCRTSRTSRSRPSTIQQIARQGGHTWQYPDDELDKLVDPRVKAFFVVNPGNPASFAHAPRGDRPDRRAGATKRPDLIILTDDVYGTFVRGFRSLAARAAAATRILRLLVLEVLRLHRLAPRRRRAARGQHPRRADRARCPRRARGAGRALRRADARARAS